MDNIFLFILFGFIAQIIDGSLGMAYGVSSNSLLLSLGLSPKIASASVKSTEVFTTMISGISHWKVGNIDWKIFRRLAITGVIGGIIGAYILSSLEIPFIKTIVSAYLLVMGGVIIYRVFKRIKKRRTTRLAPLGLVGGFFDAVGGGGWGPIVTTTMVADGNDVSKTIGTVNASEFLVTISQAITFTTILGIMNNWNIVVGLLIGGVIAAPFGAIVCKKMPKRLLMFIVGALIIVLSIRTIYLSL